jgi:hypothetical protein
MLFLEDAAQLLFVLCTLGYLACASVINAKSLIGSSTDFGGPLGPAEGPLWWKEGGYLLFTDIHNNRRRRARA